MRKKYKIVNISHSGRKGIRGTQVTEMKYYGLVGSVIEFNIENLTQFKCMRWYFVDNRDYEWWDTSEILEAGIETDNNHLFIETANTIYELEELNGDEKSTYKNSH